SRNAKLGRDYVDASMQVFRAREKLNNLLDRLNENTSRTKLLEAQKRLSQAESVEKGFKALLDESDSKLNDIIMKEKNPTLSSRLDSQRTKNMESRLRRLDKALSSDKKSLRKLSDLEKNLAKETAKLSGKSGKIFSFMKGAGLLLGVIGNVLSSWDEAKEILAWYYPEILPEGTLVELRQPSTLGPAFSEPSGYFIEIADGKPVFRTESGEVVT